MTSPHMVLGSLGDHSPMFDGYNKDSDDHETALSVKQTCSTEKRFVFRDWGVCDCPNMQGLGQS